jgi:carboxyl-terminal processing protease
MKKTLSLAILGAMLSACGGGGGNPGKCVGSDAVCFPVEPASIFIASPILALSSVAQQCAAPRPAGTIDPSTEQAYGDVQGSLATEKDWIRAFVNETYLWYSDVVALDPSIFVLGANAPYIDPSNNAATTVALTTNFDVVDAYFNSQRSLLTTASGKPKDQFHFTYPTDVWQALSTSGSSVGFGFQVALLASVPPRSAVVAYSEPGSPAQANNINRGAVFVSVNGVDVARGDPAMLNEGLFAPVAGKPYTFEVRDQGSAASRTVTLTAASVTSTPVQNVRTLDAPNSSVGYMQFNDHIATAEAQLIGAVNQLKAANGGAGISDLVLDLRYNGGGYLDIASELAYMIAGPAATAGKTFEKLSFNDKNPFQTTDAANTTPFHTVTLGFSTASGQALPQLGLPRVFVLTGGGTCSASESIINSLNGAGVKVIQIGGTTCGKPYGFIPRDNCGVTYFTVQFKGVNHVGFGDYADGFVPGGTGNPASNLPGCAVADDFTRPMGDSAEARLAAALQYRANGSCPAPTSSFARTLSRVTVVDPVLGRSSLRENRFYRPRTGRQ